MAKGTLSIAGADTLTAADLAADSVGASELADDAVDTAAIADDAITGAKMYGLGDGSGNLTGTVSSQQLHFADTFTLTGDLTVNDDLVLGKIQQDDTGQILTHTASTARVLTGTGTITMGGYLI